MRSSEPLERNFFQVVANVRQRDDGSMCVSHQHCFWHSISVQWQGFVKLLPSRPTSFYDYQVRRPLPNKILRLLLLLLLLLRRLRNRSPLILVNFSACAYLLCS